MTESTALARRILVVTGIASVAFAVGAVLFATMVALFAPRAFSFLFPYLGWAIGMPLITGGAILVLLEWKV